MKKIAYELKKGPASAPTTHIDRICPKCGEPLVKYTEIVEVAPVGKNVKSKYRHNIAYECDRCKDETDLNADKNPEKIKKRLQLQKDGYFTDIDIRRIRKKFGLTQKAMADKLGVGEKNFARYENLHVRQSRAMDNLLRVLDKYPEAIKILKGRAGE